MIPGSPLRFQALKFPGCRSSLFPVPKLLPNFACGALRSDRRSEDDDRDLNRAKPTDGGWSRLNQRVGKLLMATRNPGQNSEVFRLVVGIPLFTKVLYIQTAVIARFQPSTECWGFFTMFSATSQEVSQNWLLIIPKVFASLYFGSLKLLKCWGILAG